MNPISVMSSVVVLCFLVVVGADVEVESPMTKLWSVSGSAHGSGRTTVVDVNGGSITVQPNSYNGRQSKMAADFNAYNMAKRYAFKPRASPNSEAQVERSIHYTDDDKQKAEILFPGNYFPIAEVKKENKSEETFNPLSGGPFHPKPIPLFRNEYERSLVEADEDEEPIIEKPDENGQTASRRSLSTLFDGEDEDAEDDEEADFEEDDDETLTASKKGHLGHLGHKVKKSGKKYAKYMLPLLLAYKLKFFSMIPVMMGGLVLLVGATGMAGFFFALFAAVMGLQKGSY